MELARSDEDRIILDLVHEAMLLRDTPGPIARKVVLERFGLPEA
jgi:hypothetical protein